MRKQLLFAFLGVLTCYSCSNSYDLLENDMELARAAEDYELSTRAISEEEGDTVKIETIADEQAIQASMDEYEQEIMNRQSVAKERVMRTAYTGTTDVVGVFKVGSCGTYKELELNLDAEDTRQKSKIEGYVGDTYVDSNGNVRFKFCLTEATQYYPGGVFLVDHINYSQFGGTLDVLVRYHDCDDKHTKNKIMYSTHPKYQKIEDLSGHTVVNSNAALAWAYPHYPLNQWGYIPGIGPRNSIKYGVLAYAPAYEDLGMIYVDDEDSSNKNWLKRYKGYTFDRILSGAPGHYGINATDNTRYYVLLSTNKGFASYNVLYPKNLGPIPTPQ